MDKLHRMLAEVGGRHRGLWNISDFAVDVRIGKSDRRQRVSTELRDGTYIFTSVVLGTAAVTKSARRWRRLALLVWQRNWEHQLVTFAFDERDRLVGQIRHRATFLNPGELELYVSTLARECDRLEYLLTGGDVF